MSETYFYNGDAWLSIQPPLLYGQVFTPRQDHILSYIDLELDWGLAVTQPQIVVHSANPDGSSQDDWLSKSGYFYLKKGVSSGKTRVRAAMQPYPLKQGTLYIMVLGCWTSLFENLDWQYDSSGNQYWPRGWRMEYSKNTGIWTAFNDQCHLFGEFGTPPLPQPEPPPPIENFAAPIIFYTHWDVGLTIRLSTSVPCHLTCYYTDKKPLKHHTSRIVRGLEVPWQTYFCFVSWKTVEQTEAGDTLYHTFEFPDWLEGQTKWFTFKGEVDLEDSPSIGPIFEHTHPGGLPRNIILRPNAPGDLNELGFEAGAPPPNHYLNVDDIVPDYDTTWNQPSGAQQASTVKDLYNLESLPGGFEAIQSVTVYELTKRTHTSIYAYARNIIKTSGAIYYGSEYTPGTGYSYHTSFWATNPQTLLPWTVADINALQEGIQVRGVNPTPRNTVRCTQVYVVIERGIEGGPD